MSAPFVLSSTEDAIYLAEVTLGHDDLAAVFVGARVAMPVSGDVPPDGVLAFHDALLAGLENERDRLVLATRRRTGPTLVLEDELDRWRTMQHRHCNRELVLADWFVFVRDEVVLSLAEIAGPPPNWCA